jgi:hypothetical protein
VPCDAREAGFPTDGNPKRARGSGGAVRREGGGNFPRPQRPSPGSVAERARGPLPETDWPVGTPLRGKTPP